MTHVTEPDAWTAMHYRLGAGWNVVIVTDRGGYPAMPSKAVASTRDMSPDVFGTAEAAPAARGWQRRGARLVAEAHWDAGPGGYEVAAGPAAGQGDGLMNELNQRKPAVGDRVVHFRDDQRVGTVVEIEKDRHYNESIWHVVWADGGPAIPYWGAHGLTVVEDE